MTSRLFPMHGENGAGMKSDFSIQFSLSQTVKGLAFVLWQALFLLPIERAPPGIQGYKSLVLAFPHSVCTILVSG